MKFDSKLMVDAIRFWFYVLKFS